MMHPTDLSSAAEGIGVLVFEAEGLGFAVFDVWVLQYPYSKGGLLSTLTSNPQHPRKQYRHCNSKDYREET